MQAGWCLIQEKITLKKYKKKNNVNARNFFVLFYYYRARFELREGTSLVYSFFVVAVVFCYFFLHTIFYYNTRAVSKKKKSNTQFTQCNAKQTTFLYRMFIACLPTTAACCYTTSPWPLIRLPLPTIHIQYS